jgi:hypothetical protein
MNHTPWDEIFVGRKRVVENLMTSEEDFFIFGARRIGKTFLLRSVEKKMQENNRFAFCFSIQGDSTSEKIKRRIQINFKRNGFPADEDIFNNSSLFEFLDKLDLQLNQKDQKIVFLIDEVEEIVGIEKNESGFADKLRNHVESCKNIRFILAGSPHFKKLLDRLHSSCSPFLSAFQIDTISVLLEEESAELIQKFSKTRDIKITSEQIEKITEFTHYQPWLIRILMDKLLYDGRMNIVTRDIAMNVYTTKGLDGIFPNYFDGLDSESQKIVQSVHSKQFQPGKKYETKLSELVEHGYLKYEDSKYLISNWFFKRWLDSQTGIEDSQVEVGNSGEAEQKIENKPVKESAPNAENRSSNTKLDFRNAQKGFLCGMVCIFGGVLFIINGVTGKTCWNIKLPGGIETSITNAEPGALLLIIGLVIIIVTQLKKK